MAIAAAKDAHMCKTTSGEQHPGTMWEPTPNVCLGFATVSYFPSLLPGCSFISLTKGTWEFLTATLYDTEDKFMPT